MADTAKIRTTMEARVVQDNSPSIIAHMRGASSMALYRFAEAVRVGARARAPVDTGHLKGSITREKTGDNEHTIKVGARYGIYVEWGTRYMRAQPYLRPAVKAAQQTFYAELARTVFTKMSGPTP